MGNHTARSFSGTSISYTSNDLNQITQTSLGAVDTSLTYDANGDTIAEGVIL